MYLRRDYPSQTLLCGTHCVCCWTLKKCYQIRGDYWYKMPPNGRKRCRKLPPDLLSNLPDNIIDIILMCLPCKDAVRTSILSKKWRYHWCRITELAFDRSLWETKKDKLYPTVKFTKIIYQILTLHEGPITKFTLDIAYLLSCPKIDNFIYFLSKTGIQHLVLHLPRNKQYKLPSSLFTCSQLRHLTLCDCLIHHPLAFKGFDRLIRLELCRVTICSGFLASLISHCLLLEQLVLKIPGSVCIIEINAPMLKSFDFKGCISSLWLKNVPLLTKVSLNLCEGYSIDTENFYFAKFFESCFSLEHLLLKFCFDQFDNAEADEAPTRLPFDHTRVKRFYVPRIILEESYETLCCFCLIRSFPYLEYLELKIHNGDEYGAEEWLELERFADVTFNHLREVKLEYFEGTTPEMQLIKLLLAKSPVLVTMLIHTYLYLERRSEILAEVSKFCYASPNAEVIFGGMF